ncbi:RHS repeat-associated core domain-containing protein [Pseudomonas sp. NPDC089392]|uniref:RHS repeat-associated core domain-containing protein n=1 Tax=Pseudomonas sp. NPDC089392 TaxID=3364459 RepID=UPI0038071172
MRTVRVLVRKLLPYQYTLYGHAGISSRVSVLGFNGQPLDSFSNCYLLGNGKRAFSSILMRFCSPDELSPFGLGGISAYVYCSGDPVNNIDPTGSIKFNVIMSRRPRPRPRPRPVGVIAPSRAQLLPDRLFKNRRTIRLTERTVVTPTPPNFHFTDQELSNADRIHFVASQSTTMEHLRSHAPGGLFGRMIALAVREETSGVIGNIGQLYAPGQVNLRVNGPYLDILLMHAWDAMEVWRRVATTEEVARVLRQ